MSILLRDIMTAIEDFAPRVYQESYDNSGLIYGRPEMPIHGALLTLDCTEAVIDEAITKDCNLIIAHHPIVFKGLKSFTGKNYVERTLLKAIENKIAIYACHTNLDKVKGGVSFEMANRLGLTDTRLLQAESGHLNKLVTYIPKASADALREALAAAGAGKIGDYDSCSFSSMGEGRFRANEQAQPFVGKKGEWHTEPEEKVEVIVDNARLGMVIAAMKANHPYEEPAYEIHPVKNEYSEVGLGVIGNLAEPMDEISFLEQLKVVFQLKTLKHTPVLGKKVQKIALCGGSGSFLIETAKSARADVYVTADIKYHEFFDADNQLLLADIGHFESEQYTYAIFERIIREKFPIFALQISSINTNPINFL